MRLAIPTLLILLPVLGEAQNPDYTYRLTSASGPTGSTVEVQVLLDFAGGDDVCVLGIGVCASPGDDSVALVPCTLGGCVGEIEMGEAVLETNNGNGPDFFAPVSEVGGWSVGVIIAFNCGAMPPLLPEDGAELVRVFYELVGPPGSTSELEFCDTVGIPPTENNLTTINGTSIVPDMTGSVITVLDEPFRRGDSDSDGQFNGLVDALHILNFQFVPGSPEPICLDAADVDDSGTFSGLVDGVAALNFQFVPGSPPPPPPGPFTCGVDPTPDLLPCGPVPSCP